MRSPSGPRRRDTGQATIEFALALPLVVMVLLGAAQVLVVAVHQLVLVHAARDAVRAASVSADPAAAARAALDRIEPGMSADVTTAGDVVTVVVSARDPTDIPVIGVLVPDLTLEARASMTLEPP